MTRLQLRHPHDLILAAAWIVATTIAALAEFDGALRVALGLPFVLLWPGYLLSVALYPQRFQARELAKGEDQQQTERTTDGLDPLERAALTVGLSIATVPLVALLLNFTPVGVAVKPLVIALAAFTGGITAIAWRRRSLLTAQRQPRLDLTALGQWGEKTGAERLLSAVLAVAGLVAAGTILFVIASPHEGEPFTEFYILGADGRAADYPTRLNPAESGTVMVGIANHEQRSMAYDVRVLEVSGAFVGPDGEPADPESNTTRFEPGAQAVYEEWDTLVPDGASATREVIVNLPAGDYQLRFELFKQGSTPGVDVPDHELFLWIRVD